MTSILQAYLSLPPSSQDTKQILQSIINAIPSCFDSSTRTQLITALLGDIQSTFSDDSKSRLAQQDAATALLAVKTLGRDPSGSERLSEAATLSKLLSLTKILIERNDINAASEALRCIANTMVLFPDARVTFISDEVNGGEVAVSMLHGTTTPDLIFVLSRILFFTTVSQNAFVQSLVEDERENGRTAVDIIVSKLEFTLASIMEGSKMGRDAMSELLKFAFNLLLHYPKMVESDPQTSIQDGTKVMGDFWSSKLDGTLPPLLKIYHTLPSASSVPLDGPLTNVIHTLITIPISPSLRPIWFEEQNGDHHDVLMRTFHLLDSSFSLFFPSNTSPDDEKIRESFKQTLLSTSISPDTSPDDLLTPLVVLCTRLCLAEEECKNRIRDWIIPENLDRTDPLDERKDFLGRCLRLLGSVYHTGLKSAVGEMLFAVADQDATTMSTLFGYGHVAGFLFEKDFKSPPPSNTASSAPQASSADRREVNPITGTFVTEESKAKSPGDDMTPEEKEREMEKLFVLFDRLEKTGSLPPDQNPMRKIIQKSMEQGGSGTEPRDDD
ncbi:hypothetical protein VKT23_019366 [Stygiomarasmius scandens]